MSVQVKGSGTIGGLDEGLVVSGIVTSSTQINVGSNIKLGNAGVVTATSFVGTGNTFAVAGGKVDISIAGGGGGAVGTGTDKVFYENDITVAQSYTISSGKNAMSAGPITLGGSVVVTIPNGSVWTVV